MLRKLYLLLLTVCLVSCEKMELEKGIIVSNKKLQESLISDHDKNRDGILSKEEALAITTISIIGSEEPLDGLENFPNLEILYVPSGKFTRLDVSKNTKLRQLHCSHNELSSIDLSNNPELEVLVCDNGKLTSLYLNHLKLFHLSCKHNNLRTIDLKNVPNIVNLYCTSNSLRSIIFGNNSQLTIL